VKILILSNVGSGLYKFRKSFNRNSDKEFHVGKVIFNEEVYSDLINIRTSIGDFDNETNYFPKYRG